MIPADRLYGMCARVLDVVCTWYDDRDLPLPGRVDPDPSIATPGRRFVCAGRPAWDCELVAVWVERVGPFGGDVARDAPDAIVAMPSSTARTATLWVTVARCAPTVDVNDVAGTVVWPTVDEEQESALALYQDQTRVLEAIRAGAQAGRLPDLNDWLVDEWRVIGPEGGIVAGEHRLRIDLTALPTEGP